MSDDPLDQVNRAVIAIVALLLIFVAVLAVLIAWAEPLGAIGKLEDFTEWLRDHETREAKLILTLGAVVVVLLMAGVILGCVEGLVLGARATLVAAGITVLAGIAFVYPVVTVALVAVGVAAGGGLAAGLTKAGRRRKPSTSGTP